MQRIKRFMRKLDPALDVVVAIFSLSYLLFLFALFVPGLREINSVAIIIFILLCVLALIFVLECVRIFKRIHKKNEERE